MAHGGASNSDSPFEECSSSDSSCQILVSSSRPLARSRFFEESSDAEEVQQAIQLSLENRKHENQRKSVKPENPAEFSLSSVSSDFPSFSPQPAKRKVKKEEKNEKNEKNQKIKKEKENREENQSTKHQQQESDDNSSISSSSSSSAPRKRRKSSKPPKERRNEKIARKSKTSKFEFSAEELGEWFDSMTGGSGSLSLAKLIALAPSDFPLSAQEGREMIKFADQQEGDGDGKVGKQDFINIARLGKIIK